MNASELRPGIYRVRHTDESAGSDPIEFNLSVMEGTGLNCVAAFRDDEKPPRKGKHLLLTDTVREWIGRMELLP